MVERFQTAAEELEGATSRRTDLERLVQADAGPDPKTGQPDAAAQARYEQYKARCAETNN